MPPSRQSSEEIGLKLVPLWDLGLISRKQALGLEGQMFWSLSWPSSSFIGDRDLKGLISRFFCLSYIYWSSRAGATSFEMSLSLLAMAGCSLGYTSPCEAQADDSGPLPEHLWEPGCSRWETGQGTLFCSISSPPINGPLPDIDITDHHHHHH